MEATDSFGGVAMLKILIAERLGMRIFLLTDCLINKENKDISQYPHGGFTQLYAYVKELLL